MYRLKRHLIDKKKGINKYFSQINAKKLGDYWNICTFVLSYYYCNLIKDLSYKFAMEHLEVIKVSEEKMSSERNYSAILDIYSAYQFIKP